MLVSIQFWVFCVLLSVFLNGFCTRFVPWFGVRAIIYYVISIAVKRSTLIFKRASPHLRADGKTIAVIGASSGIGQRLAEIFCEKGANVIWAARSIDRLRRSVAVHGGKAMRLDLADLEGILQFAAELKRNVERLDVLVLNAAYLGVKRRTNDGFDQNFGVNHLGHMLLVHELMDLIVHSAPCRIVVVASDLHRLCPRVRFEDLMFDEAGSYRAMGFVPYNHSKLCNVLFARELARRLQGSGVIVHAAHPGTPVESELSHDQSVLGWFGVRNVILPVLFHLFCRNADAGAQTLLHCALDPSCAHTTGRYFENVTEVDPSPAAQELAVGQKLWDVSCELLKIDSHWPKSIDDSGIFEN